jgi:hypothetical protein
VNLVGGTHAFQCLLSVRFQIRHFAHPLAKQRAKFWTPAATIICADVLAAEVREAALFFRLRATM